MLGLACRATGRTDDARRAFREVLRIDPDDARAAAILREMGDG
jgi:predicted TPR repeat methyltransferase